MKKKENPRKGRIPGHILAITAVVIWSVSFCFLEKLLDYATFAQLLPICLIPAYLVLFLIHPRFMRLGSVSDELKFIFMGAAGFFGTYTLFNMGRVEGGGALMQTAICCVPLTVFVSLCVSGRREKLTLLQSAGLVIALVGSVISIMANGSTIFTSASSRIVVIFAAACLCRGIYSTLLDAGVKGAAIGTARRTVFWGLIISVVFMFLTDGLPTFEPLLKASSLINIAVAGAGGCGIAYAMWHASASRIGAEKSAYYMYLMPVMQLAFSAYVLKSCEFPIAAAIGAAVSFIGIVLAWLAG